VNRLLLSGAIAERGALRYTPAGLPAIDLLLAHEAEVEHEGQPRKVALQIRAVAIGSTVARLQRLALGAPARFAGFLAPSRNGRGLLFHVTEFDH
jgi:primosomal replication protein N